MPSEKPDGLGAITASMADRSQEDVDPGPSVHRVVFLRVLDAADHLVVDLDYIAEPRTDELFTYLFVTEPTPPLRHLDLQQDRAQAS
jgi:hypothetical protein